jgi:hypothetical protein
LKKISTKWWGTFELEENQARFWEIGCLLLGLERQQHEWRIASNSSDDITKSDILVAAEDCPGFDKNDLEFRRFIFQRTDSKITLTPIIADRSQVSHAEIPFYLAPDQHVTIYVSSPIWVRITVGAHASILDDIPTLRQSDTWHGPNTREGELCYSSRMFCRTNLNDLPLRANRVLTPVKIFNHDKHSLLIEQLSIPLPFLSVYVDNNGSFWTEEIIVRNEPNHGHTVKQGRGAPPIAAEATLLSTPRLTLKPNNFINLFYSLLTE